MSIPVTQPCYLTISQSENCPEASHTLWPTSSTWSLKELCWNPLGILKIFGGPEPPTFFHSPTRNLSLLQTSTSPFVWPRSTLGIWAWVNSMPGHVPLLPCMNGCKKKPKLLSRCKTHGWNSCLNFYTVNANLLYIWHYLRILALWNQRRLL